MTNGNHVWRFFRAGDLDQVVLDSAQDLLELEQLDQKLWVALGCPTRGLEFDARTLQLVDSDNDGRIRPPELIQAIKWAAARLKSVGTLANRRAAMPLDDIDQETPEGKQIHTSALRILRTLGKAEATGISTDDTTDTAKILAATLFNGDGVVPAEAARSPEVAQAITDIIASIGSVPDRSGKPGVSKEKVDAFFGELQAFVAWSKAGDALRVDGLEPAAVQRAFAAFTAVEAKVDEHFARLRLAVFEPRAATALNRSDGDYATLATKDLAASSGDVSALPLQRIEPITVLRLTGALNPAWQKAIDELRQAVVAPLIGAEQVILDESQWAELRSRFKDVAAWAASKKGTAVEKLGRARCEELLAGPSRAGIEALIAEDLALAPEFDAMADVDRLVHYHRHLFQLLTNFVNFSAFYDPHDLGIFQAGTLYLDQRSCDLCLRVDDPGAHATIGVLSRLYVAYCTCTRGTEKMTIAAAFTQGDADYLMVGRNGVFYDRQGRDWDATITKVIENPISLRQAFWSPYKKAIRLIEEQIEKFAASKEKAVNEGAAANITSTARGIDAAKLPDKPSGFDVARFAGIFAAIGLAIGAIGGALGAMVSAFASLAFWQMPLAIGGIVLAISGPSMIIAGLKLRQRTLGPLLEGNGWAINGRVRINIPLGTALTAAKKLPPNSKQSLVDPFEDKEARRRNRLTLAAAILLGVLLAAWLVYRTVKPLPPPAVNVTVTPPK